MSTNDFAKKNMREMPELILIEKKKIIPASASIDVHNCKSGMLKLSRSTFNHVSVDCSTVEFLHGDSDWTERRLQHFVPLFAICHPTI